ncbi:hypothetical protein M422DRAFT_275066 [Sphaerobolus stellatus SS14]|uniref:Uncharacterized protein n=1 Tax=Sphaerobolus stellatus (strain SS14) TaxID=990650 RepID=A0A0C9UG34_SPHS4|nr:hypothetical protein M422DRAFT_275066 [Sphaerobolus stellatus SS14]
MDFENLQNLPNTLTSKEKQHKQYHCVTKYYHPDHLSALGPEKVIWGEGTPPDFRPEPFRPELSLASSTLWKRFRMGFTLNTFVDSCGRRVGGLVGDSGRLVEDICAYSHSA